MSSSASVHTFIHTCEEFHEHDFITLCALDTLSGRTTLRYFYTRLTKIRQSHQLPWNWSHHVGALGIEAASLEKPLVLKTALWNICMQLTTDL